MMAALTSSTLQLECAPRTSAASPATCGEAIEVPLSAMPSLPVPTATEKVVTPGAATSGLMLFVTPMPREEKPASWSMAPLLTIETELRRSLVMVTLTGVPASSWLLMALVPWLTRSIAGMTSEPVTPDEHELTSLPKMTPAAPPVAALPERPAEPQRRPVPSSHMVMTILPATLVASLGESGEQASVLLVADGGWVQSPSVTTLVLVRPGSLAQSYATDCRAAKMSSCLPSTVSAGSMPVGLSTLRPSTTSLPSWE